MCAFIAYRLPTTDYRLPTTDYRLPTLPTNYIQHNPNVEIGRKGFVDFFRKISKGKKFKVSLKLDRLVAVQAEGEYVTMAFVWNKKDPKTNKPYTSTWFDMFRITSGKIVEHWDNDIRR